MDARREERLLHPGPDEFFDFGFAGGAGSGEFDEAANLAGGVDDHRGVAHSGVVVGDVLHLTQKPASALRGVGLLDAAQHLDVPRGRGHAHVAGVQDAAGGRLGVGVGLVAVLAEEAFGHDDLAHAAGGQFPVVGIGHVGEPIRERFACEALGGGVVAGGSEDHEAAEFALAVALGEMNAQMLAVVPLDTGRQR